MGSSLSGYGLLLLWLGAVALGGVVTLRKQPSDGNMPTWFSPQVRKHLEAVCLFVGASGLIAGLGLLGLGGRH